MRRQEETQLIQSLAQQYGLQHVDLRGVTINPEALQKIPEDVAKRGNIAGFELANHRISVAIRNPNNPDTKAAIADLQSAGLTVTLYMTSSSSLEHAWVRYQDFRNTKAVKKGILDINPDAIEALVLKLKNLENIRDHIIEIRTVNSAKRVSETIETMFASALALGASDVHIEPEENGIRFRLRLDGVLHDVIDLDRTLYQRLISRLKLLSGMILNKRDTAQDGRFTFDIGDRQLEVRSSVIPGSAGESIVMRLLDPTVASFTMEHLHLNDTLREVMEEELKRPNGLIITTGPTGSGKTTALYAFLKEVHSADRKIITLENPVEYKLDGIVQTQIEDDYTFSTGLRAVLRQDPDVIMVGEIRDREVAETAVHAAQTGHLVFTTLHTNSAAASFARLIDLGVDPRVIGTACNIILGQRLVRVLCDDCKEAYQPNAEEQELIMSILEGHPKPPSFDTNTTLYKPGGCDRCGQTGYKGRQSVFEGIRMDAQVEEALLRDSRAHIILEASANQGIPTMAEDGIEKVIKGMTSLEELQRVVDLSRNRDGNVRSDKPDAPAEKNDLDDQFASHIV